MTILGNQLATIEQRHILGKQLVTQISEIRIFGKQLSTQITGTSWVSNWLPKSEIHILGNQLYPDHRREAYLG